MSGDVVIGAASAWLIAAIVLGIVELAAPGVFLVFLAIAAAITGLAVFALPGLPLIAQLASFTVWSAVSVIIGRRWYSDYPVTSTDALLNDRAARLIGEVVTVEVAIVDGRGRVRVGDGAWPARGPAAAPGDHMRVVAVQDGELVVKPLASLT